MTEAEKARDGLAERLRELRDFLSGQSPLDGLYFGDAKKTSGRFMPRHALYWWRHELRRIDAAADFIESALSLRGEVIEECARVADYAVERAERDWRSPNKQDAVKQVGAEIAEVIRSLANQESGND